VSLDLSGAMSGEGGLGSGVAGVGRKEEESGQNGCGRKEE